MDEIIYGFIYILGNLQNNGIDVKVNMIENEPITVEFTSEGETQVLSIGESKAEINRLLEKFHKKG